MHGRKLLFSFEEKNDELFENIDFREIESEIVERYESCEFISCNFQSLDLAKISFVDCTFKSCNLSLIEILDGSFERCFFESCKMLSLNYSSLQSLTECKFDKCKMESSSFS